MKKRITETLLGLLAFVCCLPMMAQQHPEWQSQYAIGLNKLARIRMYGLIRTQAMCGMEIMRILLTI